MLYRRGKEVLHFAEQGERYWGRAGYYACGSHTYHVVDQDEKSSFLASGHFYSSECYFFLCRYAVPVEDRIEEKGVCTCIYVIVCLCVRVHTTVHIKGHSFCMLTFSSVLPPSLLYTPFPFPYLSSLSLSLSSSSFPSLCFPFISISPLLLLPPSDEEDEDSEDEDPDQEIQTVVYFWQGRLASNMGWLHFTLG